MQLLSCLLPQFGGLIHVRQIMRTVVVGVVALVAIAMLRFTVAADQWAGPSVPLMVLVITAVTLLGGLCYLLTRSRLALLFPASALMVVSGTSLIELSPVKPALRAVAQIGIGMTEGQVRSILLQAFPADGKFRRPDFGRIHNGYLSFVLDPNDPRYNSAWVVIRFAGKRSIGAEFLAD